MYAVVDIAGKQFKVAENDRIRVPSLKQEKGTMVTFDRVVLLAGEGEVRIGNPIVTGARVQATVVDHVRGEKVIVFKKKRRKGYRVKRGHRQGFTDLQVTKIG
ncbi:MAG: 50S ribosomal protein L21 [Ignavibacteria bacterium]